MTATATAPTTRIEREDHDGGFAPAVQASGGGVMDIATTRAAQEVQAAMVIAKKFPRDANAAYTKIMQACKRKRLADQALYAYPRGGQVVTGPSIRLAEELARDWGNIDFGVIELEQSRSESTCMSYAWDLETNTRQTKIFTIRHERHTKRGVTKLTDPRDVYETIANQGARRLRACILGIIPGDVTEEAVRQCERTMGGDNGEPIADRVRQMISAFSEMGVTSAMIEARIGHKLEATNETELVNLRKIFQSLRDNMAIAADFFDVPRQASEKTAGLNEAIDGGGDRQDAHNATGAPKTPDADNKTKAGSHQNDPIRYQVLIDVLAGKCDCTNQVAERRLNDYTSKLYGAPLDKLDDKQVKDTRSKIDDGTIKAT